MAPSHVTRRLLTSPFSVSPTLCLRFPEVFPSFPALQRTPSRTPLSRQRKTKAFHFTTRLFCDCAPCVCTVPKTELCPPIVLLHLYKESVQEGPWGPHALKLGAVPLPMVKGV